MNPGVAVTRQGMEGDEILCQNVSAGKYGDEQYGHNTNHEWLTFTEKEQSARISVLMTFIVYAIEVLYGQILKWVEKVYMYLTDNPCGPQRKTPISVSGYLLATALKNGSQFGLPNRVGVRREVMASFSDLCNMRLLILSTLNWPVR
jgi:hypothetical protein